MSVNHAAPHPHPHAHSLPSFAQAFSPSSLGQISHGSRISLPPIQPRPQSRVSSPGPSYSRPPSEEPSSTSRKRARPDDTQPADDSTDRSPRLNRVKEEPDQDMLAPSPPEQHRGLHDTSGAPPPSSVHPLKRRRVTVSGPPQPGALNTDVRAPADQANSTPISPVVVGFTIQRDNPNAVEQVRSMISVKQQQKALIEQRRGSVAGLVSPPNLAPPPQPASGPSEPPARAIRKSPHSARRLTNAAHPTRPPSPIAAPPPPPPPQTHVHPQPLPPPPISFARRRATQIGAGGKKKPADIVISPREQHTKEQLALSIQSAPPIPRADGQQGSFYSGRSTTMTIPRLPSVLGATENMKRVTTANVPPTPTRLSLLRNPSGAAHPLPGISGRSPPTASVAIASTLVPPTPSSLHHPGYTGEKSAFLAPFESFYDALNDSKQLKNWLGDQLQKSQSLMQSLHQQQEQLHEIVESLVEKKVGAMRSEMGGMQRRIEQLEDALRVANGGGSGRRSSIDYAVPYTRAKDKQVPRNGLVPPDTYTFPPVDRERHGHSSLLLDHGRMASPGWHHERDSESGSPAPPFSTRRLSTSASRLDPPQASGSRILQPPREGSHPLTGLIRGRPGMSRQHSSPRAERRISSPPQPLRREEDPRPPPPPPPAARRMSVDHEE